MASKPQKQKTKSYFLNLVTKKKVYYKKPQTEQQRVYQEGRY